MADIRTVTIHKPEKVFLVASMDTSDEREISEKENER